MNLKRSRKPGIAFLLKEIQQVFSYSQTNEHWCCVSSKGWMSLLIIFVPSLKAWMSWSFFFKLFINLFLRLLAYLSLFWKMGMLCSSLKLMQVLTASKFKIKIPSNLKQKNKHSLWAVCLKIQQLSTVNLCMFLLWI